MEHEVVINAINAFYKGAGVRKTFKGPVNEEVAKIFGTMLSETKKCSNALEWVPSPPRGKATVSWIVKLFRKVVIKKLKNSESLTCVKAVIYKWGRKLDRAAILG